MYREDEVARDARAHVLITEIAEIERHKLARAELDQRLEAARRELATLQVALTPAVPPPPAGLVMHLVVFGAAAVATFAGYTLLI